jgi:hypothetical protein
MLFSPLYRRTVAPSHHRTVVPSHRRTVAPFLHPPAPLKGGVFHNAIIPQYTVTGPIIPID